MQLARRTSYGRSRKVIALLGVTASAVVITAGLAFAATGSGSNGDGELIIGLDFVASNPNPCAVLNGSPVFAYHATIDNGNYSATSGGATATYNGPVNIAYVQSFTPDTYYEGPDGTHGTDDECDPGTVGTGWPGIAQSSGTNANGSTVLCQYTAATYSRTNFEEIDLTASGECDIDENGADGSDTVNDSPTNEVREATLGECQNIINPDTMIPDYCDTDDDSYTASNA